jgi:hypothetical protein
LWKNTLSQIPSVCGRLIYLAGLRNPDSGAYRHHGLSLAFGREESGRALRESHGQVFLEWLKLPLAAKSADLITHLDGLEAENAVAAANWLRASYPATLIPESATRAQRAHFLQESRTLLELIKNQAGGNQVPGSAPRA